jgi:hypothetical protein
MNPRGLYIMAAVLGAFGPNVGAQVTGASWRLGSPLSIGSETDPRTRFSRIATVLLLRNFEVVVANGDSKELRFFDAHGKFVRQSGREGAGPGEYRELERVFRAAGDSLGIYDGWTRRLSVLTPSGVFTRGITLARPPDATGHPIPVGTFRDGTFASFIAMPPIPGAGQGRGAIHRVTATWFRHSASGEFIATLGKSPAGEHFLELSEGMVVNWAVPFQRMLRLAVATDRVFAGDGSEASVVVLQRDGVKATSIHPVTDNLNLTPSDVAAYRQEQLDRAPSPHHRTQLERSFSKTPAPATMPAFGALRVDDMGALWIQEYRRPGADSVRWRVVSVGGAAVATLEVPANFEITDIRGDRVAGIWRDESDVETVRVFQLRR